MAETELAAVARTYALSGWSVFPVWGHHHGPTKCGCPNRECDHPAKHPMIKGGVNGATHDLPTVSQWWTRWPAANIGLPAGANNLAILDVDPRHDGDQTLGRLRKWLADRDTPLPATLTSHTGGGGQHWIFTAPEAGIKSTAEAFGKDMPGLDTRGAGGYIVAPPSRHASGRVYQWEDFCAPTAPWPAILTPLMRPVRPEPAPPRQWPAGNPPSDTYASAALDGEIRIVRATGEGNRNSQLNTSAFKLGQLVGAGLLDEMTVRRALYDAATSIGLDGNASARTIVSGLRAGIAKPRARSTT